MVVSRQKPSCLIILTITYRVAIEYGGDVQRLRGRPQPCTFVVGKFRTALPIECVCALDESPRCWQVAMAELLPSIDKDFESRASASSATPAKGI